MYGSPILLALALASILSSARGQDPEAETLPSDPVFEALLVDGTNVSGRLAGLDAGSLTLVGDGDRTIPLDRVVVLNRRDPPRPSGAERSVVLLPDGDRLKGIIGPSEEDALMVTPSVLEDTPTPIPLDAIVGVVLAPPGDAELRDALLDEVRSTPRDAEVLWLSNGDRLSGGLVELGSEAVSMHLDAGEVDVPRSTVVALGFDPALTDYPAPKGISLELSFVDGSRLGVAGARYEDGRIVATTRFGVEIRPTLRALSRIHVRSDRIAYLSERREAAAQYTGYLGHHPETYGRDRTWDGHPIRVGGLSYDRGLGTLPRTYLIYPLDPADARFQAVVALDDRAGDRGSVQFRVLVDREERFASTALTKRDAPVAVDVDVSGGRFLILVTDYGESGDVEDSAAFLEARLIRD